MASPAWGRSLDGCSRFEVVLSRFPGGYRRGETPVPIPNTAVKPSTADGTAGVTPWESRSLPGVFPHAEGPAVAGLFGVRGCGLEPTALSLNGCQLIIETMQ